MSDLPPPPAGRHGRRSAALRRSWPLIPALLVLLVFSVGLGFTAFGRAAVTSAFFLPDMMAPLPIRPVTWTTATPVKESITIDYDGKQMPADIYRPGGGGQHGAMILSPGAPPLAPDDSRLLRLAGDVSRAGFVMLVPFSPDLNDEMIYPSEVDALVSEFQYLEAQPYVKPDKIGFIGVSVGAPLALLAASDSRINDQVSYVVSFGGYYDANDVLKATTTHTISYDGTTESWTPSDHTVEVMYEQIINRLDDAYDRDVLTSVLIDGDPNASGGLHMMTPEGWAAYDLLTNTDPSQEEALLQRLPAAPRQALSDLSLDGKLSGLRAETFILHDKTDKYVPYTESRKLRDALQGQVKLQFTEVDIFQHVEPTINRAAHTLITDGAKLYFYLFQILTRLR